jgi:uncharacterized protein YbcI
VSEINYLQGGRLLVEISNRVVGLFRDFSGKGPSQCQTYWASPDLLVILLRGGFTVAEQTLFDGGHGRAVRDSRQSLQETLETRLTGLIEELTRRKVLAFMSASHQEPDLQAELFVFEPEASAPAAGDDLLPA